jgi:hypothetical protein
MRLDLTHRAALVTLFAAASAAEAVAQSSPGDPLHSWDDDATKKAIIDFVAHVTSFATPDFVPAEYRNSGVMTFIVNYQGTHDTAQLAEAMTSLFRVKGWNHTVRLYRPQAEIVNGKWKFPEPQPVN